MPQLVVHIKDGEWIVWKKESNLVISHCLTIFILLRWPNDLIKSIPSLFQPLQKEVANEISQPPGAKGRAIAARPGKSVRRWKIAWRENVCSRKLFEVCFGIFLYTYTYIKRYCRLLSFYDRFFTFVPFSYGRIQFENIFLRLTLIWYGA